MEISHIRTRKEKSIRERKERKKGKKRKENLYHDRTRRKSLSHPNNYFVLLSEFLKKAGGKKASNFRTKSHSDLRFSPLKRTKRGTRAYVKIDGSIHKSTCTCIFKFG
jgi:hypothetical protein